MTTNVDKVARLLKTSKVEAIEFYWEVQRRLHSNPSTYGVAVATKRYLDRNPEAQAKPECIAAFMSSEQEFQELGARWQAKTIPLSDSKQVEKKQLEEEHQEILDILRECMLGNIGHQIEWEAGEVYSNITDDDQALARRWMSSPPPKEQQVFEGLFAKMLSARCAEKVTRSFYESLGHSVEDVALSQLVGADSDWITHDLLINDSIPIDVKNARTPFGSRDRYIEHCVPRFKSTRDGQEVTIAGVLQPYVKCTDMREGSIAATEPVRFLGEIRRSAIWALEKEFRQENVCFMDSSRFAPKQTIPPWLFDFPTGFYEARNESQRRLQEIAPNEIPGWGVFLLLEKNPIPAFLASGLPLPAHWNALLAWQQELYDRLLTKRSQRGNSLTLPDVFLSVLSHFLHIIRLDEPHDDYAPQKYRDLLFDDMNSPGFACKRPLGICDPLNTVSVLCSNLQTLWETRQTTQLTTFKFFKFNGLGLLQGKVRRDDTRWTTILAYCGGVIEVREKRVKCGHTPLILGRHKLCPQCRRLVCPECGYCLENCPEYQTRARPGNSQFSEGVPLGDLPF